MFISEDCRSLEWVIFAAVLNRFLVPMRKLWKYTKCISITSKHQGRCDSSWFDPFSRSQMQIFSFALCLVLFSFVSRTCGLSWGFLREMSSTEMIGLRRRSAVLVWLFMERIHWDFGPSGCGVLWGILKKDSTALWIFPCLLGWTTYIV